MNTISNQLPVQVPFNYAMGADNPFQSSDSASDTLQYAKMLLAQKGMDPSTIRANNLIRLAETALKNGNQEAADRYANQAMNTLDSPKDNSNEFVNPQLLPETPTPEIPGSEPVNQTEPVRKPASTEHTYKDISHDIGVSFSSPTKMSGAQSFLAVPAHEAEHVRRRIGEAVLKGNNVMVIVSYQIKYDPVTGEPYMAGGETKAISLPKFEVKHKQIQPMGTKTNDNQLKTSQIDVYA